MTASLERRVLSSLLLAWLCLGCGRDAKPHVLPSSDAALPRDASALVDSAPREAGAADAAASDAREDAGGWTGHTGLGAPRLLYRTDAAAGPTRNVALDDAYLYWTLSDSSLWRGDREGSSPAERIVAETRSAGFFVVDETSIYWTNRGKLVRFDKQSGALLDLPLGRELLAPRIIQDRDNLYVFEVGCSSINIVPKDGAPPDMLTLPGVSVGSVSSAAQDADHVYCGNFAESAANGSKGPSIFRRSKAGGAAQKVAEFVDYDLAYNPQLYAFALIGDSIHAALGALIPASTLHEHAIFRVPVAGGTPERVVGPVMRGLMADGMVCDERLQTCYYWAVPGQLMMAYDTRDARVVEDALAYDVDGMGPIQDDEAIYWPARQAIYRQDKLRRPDAP